MKNDLTRYIGIPYTFNFDLNTLRNRNTITSINCAGLVKLFYLEHNYKQTCDDGKTWNISKNSHYLMRLLKYLNSNFKFTSKIEDLEYGDIVCLLTGTHLGIYVGNGNILTIEKEHIENVSKTIIYSKKDWINIFKFGFKHNL